MLQLSGVRPLQELLCSSILLDVFAASISTLPNSTQNQKIHLQPVPCVVVTTQRITAANQSKKSYNVPISSQTQILKNM
jgi:hypothetical protein